MGNGFRRIAGSKAAFQLSGFAERVCWPEFLRWCSQTHHGFSSNPGTEFHAKNPMFKQVHQIMCHPWHRLSKNIPGGACGFQ